jgi:hypothetical protein
MLLLLASAAASAISAVSRLAAPRLPMIADGVSANAWKALFGAAATSLEITPAGTGGRAA